MNSVAEIENAVKNLSRDELAAFRAWFQAFDAEAWDIAPPAPQHPNDSPESQALKTLLMSLSEALSDEDLARPKDFGREIPEWDT